MKKLIVFLVLVFVVDVGWAKKGASDNFSKVKSGQSQDQVRKLLGDPKNVSHDGDYEIWSYTVYTSAGPTARTVVFEKNKVSHTGFEQDKQAQMDNSLAVRQQVTDEISKVMLEERKKEEAAKKKEEMEREALLIKKREQELKSKELAIKQQYADFNYFMKNLQASSYAYDRYDVIYGSVRENYVTCSQAVRILETFTYTTEKMKALKILRYRLIDPQNQYIIVNYFVYPSHQTWARNILAGNDYY